MIEYRKATIDDAEELALIRGIFLAESNNESSTVRIKEMEQKNLEYFKNGLKNEEFIAWIAVDDNRIIATSGISFSNVPPSLTVPDGRVAYIMNMYTRPEYRNQGIGSHLFKTVANEAISRNYKKLTLFATKAGRPLYEKYGFEEAKGNMVFYIE